MDKRIAFTLFLALGLATVSMAAEGTWTQKADMPTARSLSTSVVNGKIYAIGGMKNASAPLSTVEEYDPSTDTWTTKSNMPTARLGLGTSMVDGRIYAIGGGRSASGSGLSTVEEYDPVSDTWTTKSDMPTARFVLSASVVNGKIYAIGGKPAHGVSPLRTVEEYDPATDTWTTKADMPTARFGLSTCAVNGKIYAIGGDPGNSSATYIGLPTIEEYDPVMDTWTKKSGMPTARGYLSTSAVNGKIYAIGGGLRLISSYGLSTVEEYDPATDTWTTRADMPTRRFMLASSVVNNKIYAIGGAVGPHPWPCCPTVEEYDPNPLVVDFNGDGIVDGKDLLIMTAHWGEDYPSCDIGPLPFGDGVVDVQDVIVLAEHIGEEVDDPTLVAHWALDETEGDIAYDSVGLNDGTVIGVSAWRPDSGIVDGALEFDGTTFVVADFVIDPSAGPFSVLAWVKGGAPGQAIISQQAGANWLMFDPGAGTLMTELRNGGRLGNPLYSDAVISGDDWHRVGFTWDGSTRRLHVDDILVAEDTQAGLAEGHGGLNIGAGKNLTTGTFFSGLIDDVRIYNRAVKP